MDINTILETLTAKFEENRSLIKNDKPDGDLQMDPYFSNCLIINHLYEKFLNPEFQEITLSIFESVNSDIDKLIDLFSIDWKESSYTIKLINDANTDSIK